MRLRFDLWVRKIPWSGKWQPIQVFLPGKFHGEGSLVGHSLGGVKELDTTEPLSMLPSLTLSSSKLRNLFIFGYPTPGKQHNNFSTNMCYCSVSKACLTLCDHTDCTCQASLSFTVSGSLLKLMSIESVMPSNLQAGVFAFLLFMDKSQSPEFVFWESRK